MIIQELQLDASSADSTISDLDRQLQQTAELFKVALADAMSILGQDISVPVSADTTQAITDIGTLAEQPPVDVPVSADVTEATTDIAGLADQPPIDVPVTADTTEVQSALDEFEAGVPPFDLQVVPDLTQTAAAIAEFEAGVAAIQLPVEADTTNASAQMSDLGDAAGGAREGVEGLEGSVAGLGAAVGIAEGSAKELVSTIGEMGGESTAVAAGGILALAGATAGFFTEGLNAVSAGQRFNLVLGDMANKAEEIDINGLDTSMEDLGIQFGSTGAEMENANSKLFQFAINAGATKEKAVEFAQQVETLAARAISLNPQLGTLADVTETLGPKLARGGRFASEFGLALTPAEIAARALSDTGKTLNADLTVQEKAMAGAEIASERYGATLAGTVAEGSKNAAVEVESLKASFKEALEQIGVPIVAPVFDILKEAEPDAVMIAETLGTLAKDVLPVVAAALGAVAVPLEIVDAVITAIPAPVITATAAFYATSVALDVLAASATFAAVPILPLAAAVAVAVVAVSAFNSVFGDAPPYVDDVTRAIDSAAKGFDDFQTSVHDVIDAEVEAALKNEDLATSMNHANVSTDDLVESLIKGGPAFDDYTLAIEKAAVANGIGFEAAIKLDQELKHLRDSTETAAMHTLEAAVATGKLSDGERTEAERKAGMIDGHVNWAAALDMVQPKIKAAQEATDAQAQAEQDAADKAKVLQDAFDGLATSAPDVAASLDDVNSTTAPTSDSMLALALSIDKAHLSADQMQAVADNLGVKVEDLTGFVTDAKKALDDFVDAGLSGLPTLSSAIDDVLDPKKKPDKPIIIDPKKLQAEIDHDLFAIGVFNSQLADLHARGLDNLAKVAAERGPEFTNALTQSIKDSGTAQALEDKFGELNDATKAEGPLLRKEGEGIITATGEIGDLATTAFGDRFHPQTFIPAGIGAAADGIMAAKQPVVDAAGMVGGEAGTNLAGQVGTAGGTAVGPAIFDVGEALMREKQGLLNAGEIVGAATGAGIAAGIGVGAASGIPGSLGAAGDALEQEALALQARANTLGLGVGTEFSFGLAAGIGSSGAIAGIEAAAGRAILSGVAEARKQAGISSPSKVMMELGRDMVDGLVLGLAATPALDAAAANLVGAAVGSAQAANVFYLGANGMHRPYSADPWDTTPPSSAGSGSGPANGFGGAVRPKGVTKMSNGMYRIDDGYGNFSYSSSDPNAPEAIQSRNKADAVRMAAEAAYRADPFQAALVDALNSSMDPVAKQAAIVKAYGDLGAFGTTGISDGVATTYQSQASIDQYEAQTGRKYTPGVRTDGTPTFHMSGDIVVNLPPGISSTAQAKAYGDAAGQAALERLTPAAGRRLVVGSKVA